MRVEVGGDRVDVNPLLPALTRLTAVVTRDDVNFIAPPDRFRTLRREIRRIKTSGFLSICLPMVNDAASNPRGSGETSVILLALDMYRDGMFYPIVLARVTITSRDA